LWEYLLNHSDTISLERLHETSNENSSPLRFKYFEAMLTIPQLRKIEFSFLREWKPKDCTLKHDEDLNDRVLKRG
jgi:hypothetical protein